MRVEHYWTEYNGDFVLESALINDEGEVLFTLQSERHQPQDAVVLFWYKYYQNRK